METSVQNTTSPAPIVFVDYHGTVGGGQIHLLTIIDGLDRTCFTPHVVCCQEGQFAEQVRLRGITPKIIPFGKGKLRYFQIIYFTVAEALHIPYIIISGIAGIFGNYKWKGREIKR